MIRNYVKGMVMARHIACRVTIRIITQTRENKIDQALRQII